MGERNISIWKKCWSYLVDVPIEGRDSAINGNLQILLVKGRYQLCAEDAIYSFEDLYDNFYFSFNKIKKERLEAVEDVLVLGLGLGSIPLMLEANFKQSYNYTAIEIDEEVIDLASIYTLPRNKSNVQIICADAKVFVETSSQTFDLITVDLFINDNVPTQFETQEFLRQLKKLLNKNGIILFNQLAVSTKDREHASAYFEEQFKPMFPNGTLMKIKGNFMLLNDHKALK